MGAKNNTKARKFGNSTYAIVTLALIFVGVVLINYIASFAYTRIDLTEDNLYSLSDETIDLLENDSLFNQPVYFKIYLAGDLPGDLEKIRLAVEEKLNDFRRYAGDKVKFDFIDPNGFGSEEMNRKEQAKILNEGKGLRYSDFQLESSGEIKVKTVWGGAVVEYNGETKDYIHFFSPNTYPPQADLKSLATQAISNLEYNLIHSIRKVIQEKKKSLAFLHGHGELTDKQTAYLRSGLYDKYKISDVTINNNIGALDNLDGLIVAKPQKRFSEKDKFVIDQFVMNGGKVLWFVDPLKVSRDSLFYNGRTMALDAGLNLEDLFFNYGVRMEKHLLLDTVAAPIYVPQHPKQFLEWLFYPRLKSENNHVINNNLEPVRTEYVSSLSPVGEGNIKHTTLLKSSPTSGFMRSPVRIDFQFVVNPPRVNNDINNNGYPVAMLLEGPFNSLFKNRLTGEFTSGIQKTSFEYREEGVENQMIVVADGDVIRNDYDSTFSRGRYQYIPRPIDVDKFGIKTASGLPKYTYGNAVFALNTIDYLLDEHNLIAVRAKQIKPRRLQDLNKSESSFWAWLNLILPLIYITIIVVVMVIIRKRKFT